MPCQPDEEVDEKHRQGPTAESAEKTQPVYVFGRREREQAPANYGTVELTHSSKDDVGEDVVRSLYAHVHDGAARSQRIIACNMKVVYIPEEDVPDLAQVYSSKEMGELRTMLKSADGGRRCLRLFQNNGLPYLLNLCHPQGLENELDQRRQQPICVTDRAQ